MPHALATPCCTACAALDFIGHVLHEFFHAQNKPPTCNFIVSWNSLLGKLTKTSVRVQKHSNNYLLISQLGKYLFRDEWLLTQYCTSTIFCGWAVVLGRRAGVGSFNSWPSSPGAMHSSSACEQRVSFRLYFHWGFYRTSYFINKLKYYIKQAWWGEGERPCWATHQHTQKLPTNL